MLKLCGYCGREYQVKPSGFAKSTYCSRECMAEAYKTRLAGKANPNHKEAGWHTCETCGKAFHNYHKSSRFCSWRCAGLRPGMAERLAEASKMPRTLTVPAKGRRCVCRACGAEFFHPTGKRTYCPECSFYGKGPRQTRRCVVCGAEFQAYTRLTCSDECRREHRAACQAGDKSHLWKGGKTNAATILRNSAIYAEWRQQVLQRDRNTCQMCNRQGGKLTAHHIKPFATNPELRLVVANGITLCGQCHVKTRHREAEYEAQFLARIAEASRG